jgi:hypothetical protein
MEVSGQLHALLYVIKQKHHDGNIYLAFVMTGIIIEALELGVTSKVWR